MVREAGIEKKGNDLVISGKLGFQTVVDLWNRSLAMIAHESALHFNFCEVTASNSAGVALMVEWIRFANENHRAIDFKNIPAQLRSIISVSGIEKLVKII